MSTAQFSRARPKQPTARLLFRAQLPLTILSRVQRAESSCSWHVWTTGDFKIQDLARKVTLKKQCPTTQGRVLSLHVQLIQGMALGNRVWRTAGDERPQGRAVPGSLQPPMHPTKRNQGFVTHSAAETKQFSCPSFSSRTSLVRASPVDCSPMTMHCRGTGGTAEQGVREGECGPNGCRLQRLHLPVLGTLPLHPDACWACEEPSLESSSVQNLCPHRSEDDSDYGSELTL